MHSRDELAADFRALGVAAGDTVMVHASVRAVGPVAGGPDQIHLALKDALTDAGTMMMYASCPDGYDDVGRGHLSPAEERALTDKQPPSMPTRRRRSVRTARSWSSSGRIPARSSTIMWRGSSCGAATPST